MTYVIVSSLVTNLNSTTAQKIVNWVTTADGCVYTADATQLDRGKHHQDVSSAAGDRLVSAIHQW